MASLLSDQRTQCAHASPPRLCLLAVVLCTDPVSVSLLLPVGAVTLIAIFFFIKPSPPAGQDPNESKSALRRFAQLDWIGAIVSRL